MELIRKAIIALTAEMLCAAPAHAQAPQAAPPTFGQPEPAPQTPRLLHPMFQDHAVVQRDRPIRVYGETTPGAVVTVTLGSTSVRASTGSNGHWSATLPAMPAGGPYTLTATANGESRTASDVLIGDVFLCAGQSNMALTQRAAAGAALDAQQATDGEIRQLSISNIARTAPISTFATSARWVVGSPQTVGDFSASCYYFVRELKKTVNVPMGMVVAAWGGARVRNWVSEEALRRLAYFNDELDMLALFRTDQQAAMRRWGTAWETWWKKVRPNGGEPWAEIFDDGSWKLAPLALGSWALWNGNNPDGFVGQMWMRTTVTLTAAEAAQPATLDLGILNEEDETWINGKAVGGTSFSSKAEHVIPPGALKEGVNVIATNIFCSWRNCGMRGPDESRAIRLPNGTNIVLSNRWRYQEVPDDLIAPQLPWGVTHGLAMDFNGMIAPIGPYGLKAAVWYQGESDIYFAENYRTTLNAMMDDWRRQFDNPRLPFLVVQLPNYGNIPGQPTASGWAEVREAQRLAVKNDRFAALTVNIDIGEATNLHPTNKLDVGRRLAIAARHIVFGEHIPSGPEVAEARRGGGAVRVSFSGVTGGLTSPGGNPNGFELCGSTQASCRWANTRIDGNTIVLPSAGEATRVRYCWGDAPVCRLHDESGLPAGPFEILIR